MIITGYGLYRSLILAIALLLLMDYYQMDKLFRKNPSGKEKVAGYLRDLVIIYCGLATGVAYFMKVNENITLFWIALVFVYFAGILLNALMVYTRRKWSSK